MVLICAPSQAARARYSTEKAQPGERDAPPTPNATAKKSSASQTRRARSDSWPRVGERTQNRQGSQPGAECTRSAIRIAREMVADQADVATDQATRRRPRNRGADNFSPKRIAGPAGAPQRPRGVIARISGRFSRSHVPTAWHRGRRPDAEHTESPTPTDGMPDGLELLPGNVAGHPRPPLPHSRLDVPSAMAPIASRATRPVHPH